MFTGNYFQHLMAAMFYFILFFAYIDMKNCSKHCSFLMINSGNKSEYVTQWLNWKKNITCRMPFCFG